MQLDELIEELMLIRRKIRFGPANVWRKELAKCSVCAECTEGLRFEIGEFLLAASQLRFELFEGGAGIRQIGVAPLFGFEDILLETMLAPTFVLDHIVSGFAPEFLVDLIDTDLPTVEARGPTSEFVLSFDFGVGETF